MLCYFQNWNALDQDNTRIWQAYYEPKLLSEFYAGWQEMLAGHRQLIVKLWYDGVTLLGKKQQISVLGEANLQNPELRASLDHSPLIQQVYAEGRS